MSSDTSRGETRWGEGFRPWAAAVANCKTTVSQWFSTCASLGFLSLVCAESGEVEVVHRERAEVAELAAVEVVGEEVTGVELVRAAVAEAKVAEEDDMRRSHREAGCEGHWAATIAGPHESLGHTNRRTHALLWVCLISAIPTIERDETYLISVFVD
jgi:hypothetical protein